MFTGIIRDIGQVINITGNETAKRIKVLSPKLFSDSKIGDSIAVNGICLTAILITEDTCEFDLASETLRRTSLIDIGIGSKVQLELSLKLGDRIDGHLVYGHVDNLGKVIELTKEGETWKFTFQIPIELSKYLAPKGSVAIDGVSLTLGEVGEDFFSVYIVPHTYQNTLFADYHKESIVNIEIDPLARYAVNALGTYVSN